jgi:heptosyltransferase-3
MKNLSQQQPLRILLSRVDNIGDVILSLPMVTLLKQRFPNSHIVFLAREYVRGVVAACPGIDEFLSWDQLDKAPIAEAVAQLRALKLDVFIHVFPKRKIAQLAAKAGVKWRVGTSGRWYHYLYCNQRVVVRRSQSSLHEAQLNLQLLAPFGIGGNYAVAELAPLIHMQPQPRPLPDHVASMIDPSRFNLVIHPFSHGHAKEWPLAYYIQLIQSLSPQFNIFISGAQAEVEALTPLLEQCPQAHAVCGKLTLDELLLFTQRCNGLIASSTGPLHIAAALGIKALGLYPPPQRINPLRWGPVGVQAEYLVTQSACVERCMQPQGRTCACLHAISVNSVQAVLLRWLAS